MNQNNKNYNSYDQNIKSTSAYDDGNIPDVDLPSGEDSCKSVEPLPESSRPRKDGPGGE